MGAGVPGELDQDRAHAPGGARHEDGLSFLHLRLGVEHLVGREAVDDQCLRLVRVDSVGYLDQVGDGQQYGRGPAAGLGQGRDPAADEGAVHAGADGLDDADEVVSGYERERGLAVVAAPAHRALGEGHRGRLDPHQRLVGCGCRQGPPHQLQAARGDLARQHHLGGGGGAFCGGGQLGHGRLLKQLRLCVALLMVVTMCLAVRTCQAEVLRVVTAAMGDPNSDGPLRCVHD